MPTKQSHSNRLLRSLCSLAMTAVIFSFSGCTVYRPQALPDDYSVPKIPESYQHYYDYPQVDLREAAVVSEKTEKKYLIKTVEFPLSFPEGLAIAGLSELKREVEEIQRTDAKRARDLKLRYTNRIDFYVPVKRKPDEKRPVILISPILGGNMVVDRFASYYAKRGMVVALVHRKRAFWDENRTDMHQIEEYLRTSILRLRQAVDWIETQPEVDPERIGAFAISYGAILHSVLSAVEPRVKYSVLAMPAGPIPDVIMHCPDRQITKMLNKVKKLHGWPEEKIYQDLQEVIVTDPVLLAPYLQKDKVEVYVALFDRVVGAGRSFGLWKAMDKPRLRVLPFGHYGGILIFPYLEWQSYRSLKKHLG